MDPCELNQLPVIIKRILDAFHKCTKEHPAPPDYAGKDIRKLTKKELIGIILDIKLFAYKLKPFKWKDKQAINHYDTVSTTETFCYTYNIIYRLSGGYIYECHYTGGDNSFLYEYCDTLEEGKQKCWEHWLESINDDFTIVMK